MRDISGIASPFKPIIENRPTRDVRWPLRVVAFNAQGGRRFGGIAACLGKRALGDASVVLLCEVDWETQRSGGRQVAAELARLLGLSYAYLPQFSLIGNAGDMRGYLGIAILSAAPFEEVAIVPIPDPYGRRRMRRGRRYG
ncbi:MAG: hypothetical protein ACREQF_10985, partial [Candidatus Binataceae bacterium]